MENTKPFTKWTDEELKEFVELYKKAGAEVPTFKNKKEAIKWLEAAQAEGGIGIPHEVSEEEVAQMVENGVDVKAGDFILLGPIASISEEEKAKLEAEAKEAEEKAKSDKEAPAETKSRSQERRDEIQKEAPAKHLWLGGKVVKDVDATIVNGKTYKKVALVDGSVQVLTQEEFEAQVKER